MVSESIFGEQDHKPTPKRPKMGRVFFTLQLLHQDMAGDEALDSPPRIG